MRRLVTTLRYVLIAVIVLLLIGLVWWYFFLRSQGERLDAADVGRGAGTTAPSFGNVTGSTYNNIVQSQAGGNGIASIGETIRNGIVGGLAALSGGGTTANTDSPTLPQLSEINKTSVAGTGFVGTSTALRLRFVERGTGYVLEIDPRTGALTRLTNTLTPRVYEAIVAGNGSIALRGVGEQGEVLTSVGTIVGSSLSSSSPGTLSQTPLPVGIQSLAFSQDGEEVFYIVQNSAGGAAGIVAQSDGTKPKQIFSSAIAGWQARWLSDGRTILVQNASDGVGGYAYEIKSDGVLSSLLRNVAGLTLLPRASSPTLLFGGSNGGVSALSARLDQNTTTITLPIRTVADKCVWAPTSQLVAFCAVPQRTPSPRFLDLSHRGVEHTADAWWRVDVSAGTATLLYSPGNDSFDVENPVIDEEGKYIAFMNASDKSLWLLRVSKQ